MIHTQTANLLCRADSSEPRDGPEDAWLVLSTEATLGLGTADFLYRNLVGCEDRSRLIFLFLMGSDSRPASLHICNINEAMCRLTGLHSALAILCSAAPHFLSQLGLDALTAADAAGCHLTPELKLLADAGLFTRLTGRAGGVYRAAKGMELLCESLSLRASGGFVPLGEQGELTMLDSARIHAAKRFIAERFREKPTLEAIARACGINRAKLTRGFREMFDCSIAETIVEHRLIYARQFVAHSDRLISSVGYDSGYLNNASFSRAFHRRFGMAPSAFRARARRHAGGAMDAMAAA